METDSFIMEISPQDGRKLESVENRIRDIFIQCLVYLIKQLLHSLLLDASLW